MAGAKTLYPSCSKEIRFGPHPKKGDWVTCPCCEVDLQVVSTVPAELNWAYEGLEVAGTPPWMWGDGMPADGWWTRWQ